ncbi:hypothetical protein H2201_006201 [Coniosporium apollinis]|uniref:Uncharacterized protein n=1 Tax=Coniosporium apollinis TaxID=61459 RepID=A0ABQ9NNL4_9PEZI|nr:hypothetical protein H2201_006201 [Coniosporium apollinis]
MPRKSDFIDKIRLPTPREQQVPVTQVNGFQSLDIVPGVKMAKSTTNRKNLSSNTSDPAAASPPAPFSIALSNLEPFLSSLDKSKVYITHIDTHPWWFKRRIFAVPVLLNVTILGLLLWRTYYILPTYWAITLSMLGNKTSATIDTESKSRTQLFWIVLWRTFTFLLDFLLIKIIWPWPLTFFFERPGNPCIWRWRVGFRNREIYVRVSRKWGSEELLQGAKKGDESPFFKVRILPAIDRHYVRSKTGYLMMDANWDLDFATMVAAHRLVDTKAVPEDAFEKSILAFSTELDSWLVWKVHELDEGAEQESRKKIVQFKDRLTAMGKENLFLRWVELIQYESTQPGGFTKERQAQAVRRAEEMFQDQGIDFEEFVQSFGGVEGLPGLEGAG